MTKTIRIGALGSKLAMVQTTMAADALRRAHPDLAIEVKEILTSGDWKPEHGETRLAEAAGGKGLFAKEIERALVRVYYRQLSSLTLTLSRRERGSMGNC